MKDDTTGSRMPGDPPPDWVRMVYAVHIRHANGEEHFYIDGCKVTEEAYYEAFSTPPLPVPVTVRER